MKIDVMRDNEIAKLVNQVYERDDTIAMLIKALEAARREISRGGHFDRWKTVDLINDALLKISKGEA